MFKNTECNSHHQAIEIPKKVRTKLEMLLKIAAMSPLIVATFSGCAAEKTEIKNIPEQPTSSYVQQMEEEITERFQEDDVQEEDTQEEEEIILYDEEDEYYDDDGGYDDEYSEDEEYYEDEKYEDDYQEYADSEYNELFDRLQGIINSKFSSNEEVKMILEETLYRLYNNYSGWQKGYDDMPNVVDYITHNYLDVLENDVYKIDFVDENSKKGQDYFASGMAAGSTREDDGKYTIRLIAPKKEVADTDERNYSIEEFYHEIQHCKEGKITFNSNYFDGYEDWMGMITEGFPTFHEKFTNEYTTDVYGMWSIANKSGTNTIDYNKENGIGYLIELNGCEKLVYLLGYQFMDKIERGKVPFSDIKKQLVSKYGNAGEQFYNSLEEWYTCYGEYGWKGKAYDAAVECENSFLAIAKKDKNKAKFNHYMEKNLPTVSDKNGKNITDNVFNTGRGDYER